MRTLSIAFCIKVLLGISALCAELRAEEQQVDLSKDKVLYCVGYAHLDTQWRWDFCTTIDRYIKDTLEQNFALFEKYPEYVFNFTGSVRYEMMKEYYPELYEKLKQYVAAGRWKVSGSSVDEGDVNVPSPEAIIRQVLLGNEFFRREFGKESVDFMLPDCFGFPASMPSIWAHCGLKGFSTQKLTWGSAMGIPFKIGVWEGLDGKSVLAAFDPGPYVGAIRGPVHTNAEWIKRIEDNGAKYGVFADYHYYGVGDQGGAPKDEDVANYVASMKAENAPIRVALVSSDQMFRDITPEQAAKLPRYKGDLLLTEHSAGTLTSQSYMKRWNRKNEILADAAERAAVVAHWLGAATYPREQLNRSWVRALANQMHDILPGTSLPRAYTYSWNDEIVAMNGFADVLQASVGAASRALDTRVEGIPLVVYNALAIQREDIVEATLNYPDGAPKFVRVFDGAGTEVSSQIISRNDISITLLFMADVPAVSFNVFDVRPADSAFAKDEESPIAKSVEGPKSHQLSNDLFQITIDENGDVSDIVLAGENSRKVLAKPHGLVFTHERPASWPAWNMDWADRREPPVDRVGGPAKVRIVEDGPVRAVIEVERKARNSIITQRIQLSRGDAGRRIEFDTTIDWQSTACALKASFPLTVSNPKATYNWGMGTIERGNNDPTKYEVPSHEWFDVTDPANEFGVSILDDSKYGSDKPSDNEVRLTLLYTPGVRGSYMDQHSQDWGRHDMVYAIYPHTGDWREAQPEWQGRRLNQPLMAFRAPKHAGDLGRGFSFVQSPDPLVDIRAIKLAERDDSIIVRIQELAGVKHERLEIPFFAKVSAAAETNGQERKIAPGSIKDGRIATSLSPYSPRTFVMKLEPPAKKMITARSVGLPLPYDTDVVSTDGDRANGAIDREGRTIPAEQWPETVVSGGVQFALGPATAGVFNAVTCKGQTIELPQGADGRVFMLATAEEDTKGTVAIGDRYHEIHVPKWTDFVGQFDDRVWDTNFGEVDHICDGKVTGIKAGFIKREPIAWFSTHRHHPTKGNEAYKFSYVYRFGFGVPHSGTKTIRLPENEKIKVLAISLASQPNDDVVPVQPLYDDFSDRKPIELRHVYPPPPTPVYAGMTSPNRVQTERQTSFEALTLATPSSSDYVDQATDRTRVFRVFDGKGEYRPHPGSGAVDGALPRLNDGQVQTNDDEPRRSVWYDGAGRFYVDLGKSVSIDRINAFSWHRGNRAPQQFSLWGFAGETAPAMDFLDGSKAEWKLISIVNTKELGEGGVHASSISADAGKIGPYRHLLWITDDARQGTFFGEIDVLTGP